MSTIQVEKATDPALKLNFLSHGTLESKDLEKAREFYTEFFGLEVVRTSPVSLLIRLGGNNTIAVVEQRKRDEQMPLLNHNGFDVETQEEVDKAYEIAIEQAEKWDLHKFTKPKLQHGTYSFFFWDMDENCWAILTNPPGGYGWLFEQGDLEGKGHLDKNFERPAMKQSESQN